jgi:hypothetical protein
VSKNISVRKSGFYRFAILDGHKYGQKMADILWYSIVIAGALANIAVLLPGLAIKIPVKFTYEHPI